MTAQEETDEIAFDDDSEFCALLPPDVQAERAALTREIMKELRASRHPAEDGQ